MESYSINEFPNTGLFCLEYLNHPGSCMVVCASKQLNHSFEHAKEIHECLLCSLLFCEGRDLLLV